MKNRYFCFPRTCVGVYVYICICMKRMYNIPRFLIIYIYMYICTCMHIITYATKVYNVQLGNEWHVSFTRTRVCFCILSFMHVCVYVYVCLILCLYICTSFCIYVFLFVCVHIYVSCICVHVCVHMCVLCVYICMTCMCTYA